MTPTLLGRWQIRIFLLVTVGLVISLIVSLVVRNTVPLFVLLYVLLFGLVWDVIYQFITSFRWDRDWPTSFQVGAGIIEGALVWGLILTKKLPGIPQPPPFTVFLIQYGVTWLSIFILVQGPLRVIWLKWRYQGGQWFVSQSTQPGEPTYQQQPAPVFQGAGQYNFQQPAPPQVVVQYNPQPPGTPPQVIGQYNLQSPGTPPQVVRTSNPDPRQSLVQPYTCTCGFAFDRGNFCPRCGRPKAQQGVS